MTPPHDVQAIILTGAGEKAFCTGGDVKQRAETGDYGPTESGMFEIGNLHKLIRDVPKPVIAAVNGLAIGGGHVLQVLCDLNRLGDGAVRSGRAQQPRDVRARPVHQVARGAGGRGRLCREAHTAAVLFFAPDDASFITGQVLSVSSGRTTAG